jgi:hypothetical protein
MMQGTSTRTRAAKLSDILLHNQQQQQLLWPGDLLCDGN